MIHSPLASRSATSEVLGRFGLDAKHKLGQNFLVDDNVIGRILALSGLAEADAQTTSVVEIGPGIGTLTCAMLEHAHVVSVEMDADLLPVLAETCAFHGDRFAVLNADALKAQCAELEAAFAGIGAGLPHALVANLPYQIAATVILSWFERFEFLDAMTVMVQSEVADRIAAKPGNKDYGAYTVKLRMYAKTTGRFQVSPSCFYPEPHVESAVIRLERAPLSDEPTVVKAACEVAEAAFAQRRKNIRNSMKSRFDAQTVDALLAHVGVEPSVRGETLSPETYLEMGRCLVRMRSGEGA